MNTTDKPKNTSGVQHSRRKFIRNATVLGATAPFVHGVADTAQPIDATPKAPNIFDFAESKGSQDVKVLSYLLKWADPQYKNSFPKLHKLGDDLLRMFLSVDNYIEVPETIPVLNFGERQNSSLGYR